MWGSQEQPHAAVLAGRLQWVPALARHDTHSLLVTAELHLELGLGVPMGSCSPPPARAATGLSIMAQGQMLAQQVPFPEREQRGLFTQEGAQRCEKGHACPSSRYLSLGCARGLCRGSLRPYQLQTFICLRATRPPTFWGAAASTNPHWRPSPFPTCR